MSGEGFYKLAQHWLVAKALTTRLKNYTKNNGAKDIPPEDDTRVHLSGEMAL